MTVMLDTNIIISAALFPYGQASKAFLKALQPPYQPVVCDYVVDELHRKFREKFPQRTAELEEFLSRALSFIKLVPTPSDPFEAESRIRDPKDRPILRAALSTGADLFLTGDKDFLESSITDPRIVSVPDFLSM